MKSESNASVSDGEDEDEDEEDDEQSEEARQLKNLATSKEREFQLNRQKLDRSECLVVCSLWSVWPLFRFCPPPGCFLGSTPSVSSSVALFR